MMRQQHCGLRHPVSKLLRLVCVIIVLKLVALSILLFDYRTLSFLPFNKDNLILAQAADVQEIPIPYGVAAPPSILPDAGMSKSIPQITGNTQSPVVNTIQQQAGSAYKQEALSGGLNPSVALPSISQDSTNSTQTDITLDALARKQEELSRQESELKILEQELAGKLEKLQSLEVRLNALIKEANNENDAKLRHLIDVLTNMKARAAAQVLETLDVRTAVKVLAGMRGRQAGEILTFVKPEIAARFTENLVRMQLPLE